MKLPKLSKRAKVILAVLATTGAVLVSICVWSSYGIATPADTMAGRYFFLVGIPKIETIDGPQSRQEFRDVMNRVVLLWVSDEKENKLKIFDGRGKLLCYIVPEPGTHRCNVYDPSGQLDSYYLIHSGNHCEIYTARGTYCGCRVPRYGGGYDVYDAMGRWVARPR